MNEQRYPCIPVRVAIIGCSELSAYAVCSLLSAEGIEELVLVGECPDQLIETVSKLQQVRDPDSLAAFRIGTITEAAEAAIVVIGSEAASRTDLDHESQRVNGIARQLVDLGFDGVLLITVEPVDAMLQAAFEANVPARSIIGLGRKSDGDNALPVGTSVWCTGVVHDVPFTDLCDPECPYFPKVIEGSRRYQGMTSVSSGASPNDIAICVTRACEAIVSPRRTLIPLWTISPAGVPQYAIQIAGIGVVLPAVTLTSKGQGKFV